MIRRIYLLVAALCLAGLLRAQVPEFTLPDAPVDGTVPVEEAASQKGTLSLAFTGNAAFTDAELRAGVEQQSASAENYGLNAATAYDVGYFLELFYRKRGYSQAVVKSTITGPWSLRLAVREGPLTRLGELSITGNASFSSAEISRYLLGPLKEAFPRVKVDRELPFVESLLEQGAGLVRRLYAAEGFLDAVVDSPRVAFSTDFSVANVTLRVREGTRYRFSEVRVVGNAVFSDADLRPLVHEETQAPFTEGRLATAARKIEDFYKARGYYQASVAGSADPAAARNGGVDATLTISEGALYTFDGVRIEGTRDVPPDFVARRFRSLHGKRYDPQRIDQKFRELIGTGLFQTLRIDPEPIPGDQLRLDIDIAEAKTKEFGIGLGYGTFLGGIFTLSYSDLNLFRSGRPLTTRVEVTQRGTNGEVVYRNPWLFDTDYEFQARLYAETITLEGYSKNELGFRPSLGRQVTEHWKVETFVLAKAVNTYGILIDPESLVGRRQYSAASIGISQTLDFRNDPAIPTRGFVTSASLDLAPNGVGAVSFLRGVAQAACYVPLTAQTTLALGARGGIISPLGDDGLPIDERFFNGGATSVRSFPELKLGPKDRAGWPVGGQAFTVFNVEYRFPILGELKGAVFCDAGNVVPEAQDFGLGGLRYAVGGGLRYNLPVGPLRFDYGFNPDRRTGEPQGAFHFSIGLAF